MTLPEGVSAPDAVKTRGPVHWLGRVAQRAGVAADDLPDVPPGTPTQEAWPVFTRSMGIDDPALSKLVAEYFRLEVANLDLVDPAAAARITEDMARKYLIFPVGESDRHMMVATCDPTDVEAERSLGFTSGRTTVFHVAAPSAIQDAIDARFSPDRAVESILGSLEEESLDSVKLIEDRGPESVSAEDAKTTPVVKLTNLIIQDGIQAGASDIHIEPGKGTGNVRMRVDGVLRQHMEIPMSAHNRVISRIKILSKLDIADRLRPQDGKARVRIKNLAYDLRVSTIPTAGSEKCVIRILDSNKAFTLEDLELPTEELRSFRELLNFRDGIVLVTGPTGSGKTTTLYGALHELATGAVNIMTVEDPVEYDLPAITQTQVETRQSVTFSSALRAILRQDPDVILVGEIRDRETAETAAQAAMTGHLVLATVHANDAVAAVARLADLGLQYSTISTSLRGAIAQRLVRRVCKHCGESVGADITPDEQRLFDRYEVAPVVRAVGCAECGFTGFRGRLPIMEVLVVGPKLQEAIHMRKGHTTLHTLALQAGMRPIQRVALDWVEQGKTPLDEVERVLGQIIDEEEAKQSAGPAKILLVDDDEDVRHMLHELLLREGYGVTVVDDGQQALDVLKDDPDFSLMILDLGMPELDGRLVLEQVRGWVDTAALPVLVWTGSGHEDKDERALLEAGADDYVRKDVPPDRLMARIKAVLRRSAM